jgi:hypothetical protein
LAPVFDALSLSAVGQKMVGSPAASQLPKLH